MFRDKEIQKRNKTPLVWGKITQAGSHPGLLQTSQSLLKKGIEISGL